MTAKRQFAERPHRQKYNEYNGVLGIVVGIEEKRRDSGHIKYKIKCADCGEIHIRSASQLKNGSGSVPNLATGIDLSLIFSTFGYAGQLAQSGDKIQKFVDLFLI